MKFVLIIFTSIIFSVTTHAQITITQSDAPVAGESWTEIIDDRVGIQTIGPSGANQSWDYSINFVAQDTDVVNFVSPSSLWPPLNTYFPGSNLAFDNAIDSTVAYLIVNATGIYVNGFYGYSPSTPLDSIDLNPDELVIPFPFTFNDTRSNSSKFEITSYDSTLMATIKLISYTVSAFTADGYGSLTTPQGNFSNVLRIKQQFINVDSTFIDTSGTGNYILINAGNPDTSYSYQHLQNGAPAILFTLEVLSDDMTVEEAYYTSVLTTGVDNKDLSNSSSLVYPNPVYENTFSIQIINPFAHNLKIYSLDGKLVHQTNIKNVNNLKLILPLASGTYTYTISNAEGLVLDTGKFLKTK